MYDCSIVEATAVGVECPKQNLRVFQPGQDHTSLFGCHPRINKFLEISMRFIGEGLGRFYKWKYE